MYLYGSNEIHPPTVDSMFGEYKIARLHLSIEQFIDLYPEVTTAQLSELAKKYDAWFKSVFSEE